MVNAEKSAEGQVIDHSLNFILGLNEKSLVGFKNGHDMLYFEFNNSILTALGDNGFYVARMIAVSGGEMMEPLEAELTVLIDRFIHSTDI